MDVPTTSCAYNYVVTAHKPTSVAHSAVGNFTASQDLNLVLSKNTRLEIHKLTPEGLQGMIDVPIFGRISVLKLFRPQNSTKDLLFLLTERYKFCVLEYDESSGELLTRANGDVSDKVGRPCEAGQLGIIDPSCRLIGLHLYASYFKVIPIGEDGAMMEAFNIRLDESKVIDLAFLHNCNVPTVAVLYEDTKEQRHIKTYEISMREKEFTQGPWMKTDLEPGSSLIIPVAGTSGAVVVGEKAAVFLSASGICSATIEPTLIKAYGEIGDDGSRFLLGDFTGNLFLLALEKDGDRQVVTSLNLEALGKTSQASTISYLDSGVVFVGSCFGDSQLVRLRAEPLEEMSEEGYVEIIDSMVNLGPIVDFCVVDLDRQGQGQVVTCSGNGGDGSLRVVRNGIGFTEQASVELPGVKGIWSLRKNYADAHESFLVLSFVGETRVLGMNSEDELDEAEIAGFDAEVQTLWCGNVHHDQFVQITNKDVRLVNSSTTQQVAKWSPPEGKVIIAASGNDTQIVVATSEGNLVYIDIAADSLKEVAQTTIEGEVSCLDISSIGQDSDRADLLVVGTWSMKLLLYTLEGLKHIATYDIGGEIMPRSVLLAVFDNVPYLLCGLGDGTLLNYRVEGNGLTQKKQFALGTKPISLRSFKYRGSIHVFAASDRPTVIYSNNGKLLYSNLNENEVNHISSFNTSSFPDSLAIVKPGCMAIGSMDSIQKLHVRTVPLHEQPRRIAHLNSTRTFLVTITRAAMVAQDGAVDSLRLLDEQTFETLDVFKLQHQEMACSVSTLQFANDPNHYYAVGTAFVLPDEHEPSKGRILLLQVQNGKLVAASEKQTRGAVYNITPFHGKLLAGINSRLQLYQWEQQEGGLWQLVPECSHAGHILVLCVDVRGDFILVGDFMKSMQLLLYKPGESRIELRARDYNPAWISAAAMLDDDVYIGAENNYNLLTLRKNDDAAGEDERCRLEVIGQFYLGDFVNRFSRGSLVMRLPDSQVAKIPTMLFGTINGAIGVVASLPSEQYTVLLGLQEGMRKVIQGVGGLNHGEWRAFVTPFMKTNADSRGFVDGDLIEQFLDLKRESMDAVIAAMSIEADVDSISRLVEDLARLH